MRPKVSMGLFCLSTILTIILFFVGDMISTVQTDTALLSSQRDISQEIAKRIDFADKHANTLVNIYKDKNIPSKIHAIKMNVSDEGDDIHDTNEYISANKILTQIVGTKDIAVKNNQSQLLTEQELNILDSLDNQDRQIITDIDAFNESVKRRNNSTHNSFFALCYPDLKELEK